MSQIKRRFNRCCFLLAAAILIMPQSVFATVRSSSLQGVVIDMESHKPLPSASVLLVEGSRYSYTDDEGVFSFNHLEYGTYTLRVTYLGYRTNELRVILKKEKVHGIIIHLTRVPIETGAVIVTGVHSDNRFENLHEFSSVLKGKEFERDLSTTLGSTLKNETGFAMRSMGPAPARPVIRGLSNDRITIASNGMASNDLSATSPDHAVSFEPFLVERIEILRGPRVLLRNSSTLGGIVNLVRNELPEESPKLVKGRIGLYGESVNNGLLASAALSVPARSYVFYGDYSERQSTDLSTPKGVLQNTHINTRDYSLSAGYYFNSGQVSASLREFLSGYGIPGGFIGAHPYGVDISMFKRDFSLRGKTALTSDVFPSMEFSLEREYYHHTEYETKNIVGAEFSIFTYQGILELSTNGFSFFNRGIIGLQAEYRDFNIGGFVFTPPTKSLKFAFYSFQSWERDNISCEFALRYTTASLRPRKAYASARNEFIVPRNFDVVSSSFSIIYEFAPNWFAGGNLSRSARVPTIEELYSEGPHLAAYSYEIGSPSLRHEDGIGTELFFYRKTADLYFNITGFWNELFSYIISRNTGRINYNSLLPVYQSTGINARIFGFEGQAEYHFRFDLLLSLSLSYTRGISVAGTSPLPMIPPLKSRVELKYEREQLAFGASIEAVANQSRVDVFESPTPGYYLANAFAQFSLPFRHYVHNISINLDNVFNTGYYNHLSRVKSIMPEAGRNLRAIYRMYF